MRVIEGPLSVNHQRVIERINLFCKTCLSLILGTITSENYPNSYPDNIDREYPINADGTFVIKFSYFVLEVGKYSLNNSYLIFSL